MPVPLLHSARQQQRPAFGTMLESRKTTRPAFHQPPMCERWLQNGHFPNSRLCQFRVHSEPECGTLQTNHVGPPAHGFNLEPAPCISELHPRLCKSFRRSRPEPPPPIRATCSVCLACTGFQAPLRSVNRIDESIAQLSIPGRGIRTHRSNPFVFNHIQPAMHLAPNVLLS